MTRIRGKDWEIYADIKARAPLVVRADGRGFHKELDGMIKPYDIGFARAMAAAARCLMETSGLSPVLTFLFSDEVNLLFTSLPFNGRIEKLDSIVASYLSSSLSLTLQRTLAMDARVIPLCPDEIAEYLSQCQDEVWRNHVFSYGFYSLVGDGLSHAQAMASLKGCKESRIHELLFQKGINLAKSPTWERRGVLVYRKGDKVVEDWDLPLFSDAIGVQLLQNILK